jgi:hypothetical protein
MADDAEVAGATYAEATRLDELPLLEQPWNKASEIRPTGADK